MTALVQSFPQQSSTVTMLQTRPTSATGPFQAAGHMPQQARNSRSMYSTPVGTVGIGTYRGQTSASPVAPYAFTSTPVLMTNGNPLRQNPSMPHLRQENRTTSAPVVPYSQQIMTTVTNASRPRQATPSASLGSSDTSQSVPSQQGFTKDDSSVADERNNQALPRPLSSIELGSTSSDLGPPILPNQSKQSPDRYRRSNRRSEVNLQPSGQTVGGSALPSGSGMVTIGHLYTPPAQPPQSSTYRAPISPSMGEASYLTQPRLVSKDDMILHRQGLSEQAKRYRRRSVSSLEAGDFTGQFADLREQKSMSALPKSYASALSSPPVSETQEARKSPVSQRPTSSHGRNGSTESTTSSRTSSRPSSSKREPGVVVASANPTALQATPIAKHEAKLVNIPPRGSSDANKRLTNPSPLSKPMTMSPDSSASKDSSAAAIQTKSTPPEVAGLNSPDVTIPESPAAQHLAALNKKEAKKEGKSSRLRRAFSFGSAAELRKASAENTHNNNLTAERAKLRKDRYNDEQEAEQAAIVQKQEAAGLGEGIYSGQGHFFTGSTDNLSISSTASSASIMIRKMGKGMKKSTRSLVGLFRPKSVVGVPAADTKVLEPSMAQVSMVTVEAEREKVNVNANPHDQVGGGTGFPHLERNSMDAARATDDAQSSFSSRREEAERPRRSIVGGERERAEVLAAVKKGILKRNATEPGRSSPVQKSVDNKSTYVLPQLPHFNDSPGSSAPSTPGDDHPSRTGHRRTDSVTIEGEDYFMSVARFAESDSKSMPGTPRSIAARNISFSPQLRFHDTWTSGEYDRRGEIATCNRLTPMLAQQIKEELNSFKMEMEVHEQSKVFTHFF